MDIPLLFFARDFVFEVGLLMIMRGSYFTVHVAAVMATIMVFVASASDLGAKWNIKKTAAADFIPSLPLIGNLSFPLYGG